MLLVVETVKYSRGPSQVTVNPYAKGLFTSVPVTSYIKSSIQQKITIHVKGKKKKKTVSRDKGPIGSRPRSRRCCNYQNKNLK